MDRLISEQQVLKVLDNLKANFTCYDSVTLNEVASHVKGLPPAESKTGHWIANAPQYDMLNPQYICSECGNAHIRTTPYCEMCGARMVDDNIIDSSTDSSTDNEVSSTDCISRKAVRNEIDKCREN